MISNEKSTDLGLSAAERKELRGREAKEAIADYEQGTSTKSRAPSSARDSGRRSTTFDFPQESGVSYWRRVGRRSAKFARLRMRLLAVPDFGKGSVTHLRETFGLPSKDGVRLAAVKGK
jgi:hypothetical protein